MTSPRADQPARTPPAQTPAAQTPAAQTPAARTRPARTAAKYRAKISTLRRWTRVVLIVGTVVSLGCAVAPLWVARVGLLPALGAAIVSCLLAWKEIELERRAHSAAMLAASRRHGEQLTDERRHNAAVVDRMGRRLHASNTLATSRAATITRLNGELRRLQGDVNGLRGANSRLTRDLNFADLTIRRLRQSVALHEAEVRQASSDDHASVEEGRGEAGPVVTTPAAESDAELHTFPRRTLRGDATDLDSGDRRDAEFLLTQTTIAMPNYEEDRRFA